MLKREPRQEKVIINEDSYIVSLPRKEFFQSKLKSTRF